MLAACHAEECILYQGFAMSQVIEQSNNDNCGTTEYSQCKNVFLISEDVRHCDVFINILSTS